MSDYQLRLLIIVPVLLCNALAAWLNANVGASSAPSNLGPPLNASGSDANPVAYRWTCAAFADAAMKSLLTHICALSGVSGPGAPWDSWTNAQKVSWLSGVQASIQSGSGIYATLNDQIVALPDPPAALTATGMHLRPSDTTLHLLMFQGFKDISNVILQGY